ncbi:hypothetical protein Pcinc_037538 [Petrolisthes cinctipes]|uniref:LIM zinc-binding domain-containing protein n=1 Tax=Petrolisthes cinctipes TaxID=88211 RepID=A0AAE1BSB8_PETCI|nr:hypothetical protein Pcinc_037538 [Petrolisthes cinctipes]
MNSWRGAAAAAAAVSHGIVMVVASSGARFVWPPPKKVDTVEEGPRTPSWAPAGDPFNVPKPKYTTPYTGKRPPLLPTPPPPKDYEIVIITSPSTQPSADPAKLTTASAASASSAPTVTPACNTPATSSVVNVAPPKPVNQPAPATKVPVAKPAASKQVPSKPTASKPIQGFKPVASPKSAPKPASNVGYKPTVSYTPKGPAPGAPSLLASAPIPPPASVPIVNSTPAPAPKRAPGPAPAPAFASTPAPKPPAPTGPAPVFAPAAAPGMPKPSPLPDLGGMPVKGAPTSGQRSAPRRGRGVMNPSNTARIPICADCIVTAPVSAPADRPTCHTCNTSIRGPFVSALGKTWCPDHFVCSTTTCRHALIDMGFVEEQGALHCEDCYEKYFAPICGKCDKRVKGDCLNAVGKQFHPECFCCAYCGKVFGSGAFYLEDGLPYCEADWNDLFTTKCVGCGFPIEAGDRWVEALNNNYHSQCFKCSKCNKNLEGQSFFAKGGKPFCKAHAQRGL